MSKRRQVFSVVTLALACLFGAASDGEGLAGTIVGASSGSILKSDKGELFVLYGIKDYDPGSDLARKAKEFTTQQVVGKNVSVEIVGTKFGLRYVRVKLPDGDDLSELLLTEGLGKWDSSTWPEDKGLGALETQGQSKITEAIDSEREEVRDEHERLMKESEKKAQSETQRRQKEAMDRQVEKWTNAPPAERRARRDRMYALGRTLEKDMAKASFYYDRITKGNQLISLGNSARNELVGSYNRLKGTLGRNYGIEARIIEAELDEADARRTIDEMLQDYYRLAAKIEQESIAYNSEQQLIAALDAALPASVKALEEYHPDPERPVQTPEEGGKCGTGFVVAPGGYVLTCAHVVKGASTIRVETQDGKVHKAEEVSIDSENDWAILLAKSLNVNAIPVASEEPKLGSTVYCLGYPLADLLTSGRPKVGSGDVAALEGFSGDARHLQITAPINPGNSGGPVLNKYGEWVALVSHKLNDFASMRVAGAVPQGVNFGVKSSFILEQSGAKSTCTFPKQGKGQEMSLEEVCEKLSNSVVRVVAE